MKNFKPIQKLILATHNEGKLREFRELLTPYIETIVSAGMLNLPEPEETGATFTENALLKAKSAASLSGVVALADDSGLCVSALGGNPGIYSARWAGPNKDFLQAMTQVNKELGDPPDRSAYFICVLALVWPDGRQEIFEGRIDGDIVWPPQGNKGHGYDPIFRPKGEGRRFAEMDDAEKSAISHRGIATRKLLNFLRQ